MADSTTDIEIKDDQDLENVAAEIYQNLQLVADDVQQGLITEAVNSFAEAASGMEAIRLYLSTK